MAALLIFQIQESRSMAILYRLQTLRRSLVQNLPPIPSAFRPDVDDVVTTFDDLHIMFNYNDRVTPINQLIEGYQQFSHIFKVESCGRLVKYKEGVRHLVVLGQEACQLDPLSFSTRKAR